MHGPADPKCNFSNNQTPTTLEELILNDDPLDYFAIANTADGLKRKIKGSNNNIMFVFVW